jgi:Domain of unknown function (DUF4253)
MAAGIGASLCGQWSSLAMNDFQKQIAESRARALADFPFERVQAPGADALATWERLKTAGRGTPVVVGDDDALDLLLQPFDPAFPGGKPVSEILEAATRIAVPADLLARRERALATMREAFARRISDPDAQLPVIFEQKDAEGQVQGYVQRWIAPGTEPVPPVGGGRRLSPEETRALLSQQRIGAEDGEWPSGPLPPLGLTVAGRSDGDPFPTVHIVLVPTQDWTEIPAYLRWGGWNECPEPEVHVAALRSWRDRYGVELIGLSHDVMNLRTARRPATREEAMALAREQYAYCNDIVDQGTQTLAPLAAYLMEHEWWFFWWD